MSDDELEVTLARTPEEIAAHHQRAADLAQYGGIALRLTIDPDDPERIALSAEIYAGTPCFAAAADALRGFANELESRHDEGPCGHHGEVPE